MYTRAQINFEDLNPYLTYGHLIRLLWYRGVNGTAAGLGHGGVGLDWSYQLTTLSLGIESVTALHQAGEYGRYQ
jgi:hypothetical protein